MMSCSCQHAVKRQVWSIDSVPLWCSSSLSRPDSTRASYSAIGPWVLAGSGESALISAFPPEHEASPHTLMRHLRKPSVSQ